MLLEQNRSSMNTVSVVRTRVLLNNYNSQSHFYLRKRLNNAQQWDLTQQENSINGNEKSLRKIITLWELLSEIFWAFKALFLKDLPRDLLTKSDFASAFLWILPTKLKFCKCLFNCFIYEPEYRKIEYRQTWEE